MGDPPPIYVGRHCQRSHHDPEYSPEMSRRPKLVLIPDPLTSASILHRTFPIASGSGIRSVRFRKVLTQPDPRSLQYADKPANRDQGSVLVDRYSLVYTVIFLQPEVVPPFEFNDLKG